MNERREALRTKILDLQRKSIQNKRRRIWMPKIDVETGRVKIGRTFNYTEYVDYIFQPQKCDKQLFGYDGLTDTEICELRRKRGIEVRT